MRDGFLADYQAAPCLTCGVLVLCPGWSMRDVDMPRCAVCLCEWQREQDRAEAAARAAGVLKWRR